jgi:hypothetical protein
MAYMAEQIIKFFTVTATEALTANRLVVGDGTHTAAKKALGVTDDDYESGDAASVKGGAGSIVNVEAGGVVALNAAIESSAAGKAVTQSAGVVCGYALKAAAADGDIIPIQLA